MKTGLLITALGLTLAWGTTHAQQTQTYLRLEGFDADLVANGSGTLQAAASTNDRFDGPSSNMVFYTKSFRGSNNMATSPPRGMEDNGILGNNSAGDRYRMSAYDRNNMALLPALDQDTLYLRPRQPLQTLGIATTSSEGSGVLSVTVVFADGTTWSGGTNSVPDWFTSGSTALQAGLGRVSRTGDVFSGAATTTNAFQFKYTLPTAEQVKLVDHIIVGNTASGTPRLVVMAATAFHDIAKPQVSFRNVAATSFTARWTNPVAVGGVEYFVELATDSSFTQIVGNFSNLSNGTVDSLAVSGLPTLTRYFFRVRAFSQILNQTGAFSEIVSVDLATGLAKSSAPAFRVYPNPARQHVQVDLGFEAQGASARLVNALGQSLHHSHDLSGSTLSVALPSLPAGLYWLEVQAEGRVQRLPLRLE